MALARKLAAWYWRVMVKGDDYVEKGLAHYDAQVLLTKQRAHVWPKSSCSNVCQSLNPLDA
jgi:hypothetical protein